MISFSKQVFSFIILQPKMEDCTLIFPKGSN